MAELNEAARALPHSGIREIAALAGQREHVIRLDIGDPDFPTPAHVVDAAHAAARSGRTHYLPSAGLPDLRAALAEKIVARNGYRVDADQVVVTQGASQGIFAALLAVTRPGDGVLLPDPAWPNYLTMARLLRLRPEPYPLDADAGFVPSARRLGQLVTPETKVLLLNSPSNPTGAVVDRTRMRELLDFARDHGLWVVSDECYDEMIFDDTFTSAAAVAQDRVISAYSFSKTYAMPGWRVGYLAVPSDIAEVVSKCQESLLACVSEPAQWAALSALTGPQDQVAEMREAYRSRRDALLAVFGHAGFRTSVPAGAFYVWADITATGVDDREFALRLLDRHGVAVAPGSAFGPAGKGYLRLSLTTSEAQVAEGAKRLTSLAAQGSWVTNDLRRLPSGARSGW
ncbi:pyridoxal phosphate-dependent aminotransferase [Amycolatopsis sp. NPDC049868]|uniref:pyridoxal phosphate-dependent aminotransferase n=1 Tax=Amycolatopsis sp. NPDC049868 TaxID=3363934 RepID=UPI0037A9A5C2